MLILGVRGKVLTPERLSIHDSCPRCAKQGLRATVVQRYFHIWWIPFVPYAKRVLFACELCGMETTDEDRAETIEEATSRLRKQVGTPFYMFAGLALVLVGFAFLVASMISFARAPGLAERIREPAIGDAYVVDGSKLAPDEDEPQDEYKYLVARVIELQGPEKIRLELSPNAYKFAVLARNDIDDGRVDYKESTILEIDRATLQAWYDKRWLAYAIRP